MSHDVEFLCCFCGEIVNNKMSQAHSSCVKDKMANMIHDNKKRKKHKRKKKKHKRKKKKHKRKKDKGAKGNPIVLD